MIYTHTHTLLTKFIYISFTLIENVVVITIAIFSLNKYLQVDGQQFNKLFNK